jgi:hypothetical protein
MARDPQYAAQPSWQSRFGHFGLSHMPRIAMRQRPVPMTIVIHEGERGAHPRNRGMWAGTARLSDTRARRAAMVASATRMLRIARMSQPDALVTENAP